MDFKWKLWILEKGKTKYTIYKGIWKVVNINYTMVNSFLSSFNVFIQQKINVLIKINALGHKSFCKHPFMISKLLRTVGASLEVLKAEIHYINMWLLDKVASIDSLGMFAQKKCVFWKLNCRRVFQKLKNMKAIQLLTFAVVSPIKVHCCRFKMTLMYKSETKHKYKTTDNKSDGWSWGRHSEVRQLICLQHVLILFLKWWVNLANLPFGNIRQ